MRADVSTIRRRCRTGDHGPTPAGRIRFQLEFAILMILRPDRRGASRLRTSVRSGRPARHLIHRPRSATLEPPALRRGFSFALPDRRPGSSRRRPSRDARAEPGIPPPEPEPEPGSSAAEPGIQRRPSRDPRRPSPSRDPPAAPPGPPSSAARCRPGPLHIGSIRPARQPSPPRRAPRPGARGDGA
jgi:hypothetical protein